MSAHREGRLLERWPQTKAGPFIGVHGVTWWSGGSLPLGISTKMNSTHGIQGVPVNFWDLIEWEGSFRFTYAQYYKTGKHSVFTTLLSSGLFSPLLHISTFFPFLLLFQLLPFSISLFPSANWPSQAGLGLYISGFEATSETKAKLWVWFGLRRAYWPRRVVFLGQTREVRWGEEFVWI